MSLYIILGKYKLRGFLEVLSNNLGVICLSFCIDLLAFCHTTKTPVSGMRNILKGGSAHNSGDSANNIDYQRSPKPLAGSQGLRVGHYC